MIDLVNKYQEEKSKALWHELQNPKLEDKSPWMNTSQ